jgi:hypothetical protein
VNEYSLAPLGVATTIPAPGNGTGSRYFRSCGPAAARAAGVRAAHGSASAAPAPAPYRKKRRRVILSMAASPRPTAEPANQSKKENPAGQAGIERIKPGPGVGTTIWRS